MKIEQTSFASLGVKNRPEAADKIDEGRKGQPLQAPDQDEKQVAAEEVLDKIKALSEDGLYSVRFEMNEEAGTMVVKVVDPETGDVQQQIPAEELLKLSKNMEDLRGLILKTRS